MTNWIHSNAVEISLKHIKLLAENISFHGEFLAEEELAKAKAEAIKAVQGIKKTRKQLRAA